LDVLRRFCEYTGLGPDALVRLEGGEAKGLVKRFSLSLFRGGHERMAELSRVVLRGFFSAHEVEFKWKRTERLRSTGKKILVETIPGRGEVYRIAEASGTLRNRAVILCLFQSGVRVGCLCNWTYGMVRDGLYPELRVPVPIRVTSGVDTKLNGYGLPYYYTFLAHEAAQALRDYLDQRVRGGWRPRDGDYVFVTEGTASRGRKLARGNAWLIVKNAVRRAGLDPKAVWPHCLRKSFRKVLNASPIDEDTKEALMGHRLPGSRGNYFDYHDLDEVASKYMSCDWSREGLVPSDVELQLAEAKQELQSLKTDLSLSLSQRASLISDLNELRSRVDSLTARKGEIDEAMQRLITDPEVQALLLRKLKEASNRG
jgi:integrase